MGVYVKGSWTFFQAGVESSYWEHMTTNLRVCVYIYDICTLFFLLLLFFHNIWYWGGFS